MFSARQYLYDGTGSSGRKHAKLKGYPTIEAEKSVVPSVRFGG